MAKAFITKNLVYAEKSLRESESIILTESVVDLSSREIVAEKEVEEYLNETDPCTRVQSLIEAINNNKHDILNAAHYAEIKILLQDSKLIKGNGKIGQLGERVNGFQRNDSRFTEFCVAILSELAKNNMSASNCIVEVMDTFISKNIEVVTVNEGTHQTDATMKFFLEQLGILGKTEEFRSSSSRVNGKSISENGKVVFSLLNDKINPKGGTDKKMPINILSNNFSNNKFFSDIKNKVTTISTNYHINIYIFVIAIVIAVVVLIGFIFKIVTEFFPTSLI